MLPTREEDIPEDWTWDMPIQCDNTLDNASLETRCPLSQQCLSTPPKHSIGQLDTLPSELITEVLLACDIPALVNFQRANRRAMSLVHQLYEYRVILEHCPNVLRAIASIRADSFDCIGLFNTLSTSKCTNCDHFGPHLYLITCKRVCYMCFTTNDDYCPLTATMAAKLTGLPKRDIKPLAHVSSLPGRYCEKAWLRKALILFDRPAVLDRASGVSGQVKSKWLLKYEAGDWEPRRFMAIISAPYFGPSGQLPQWGAQCTGCRHCRSQVFPEVFWRRQFTKSEMLNHLQEYGRIFEANQYARHEKDD